MIDLHNPPIYTCGAEAMMRENLLITSFLLSFFCLHVTAQTGIDRQNISLGMCEDSEGCSLWEFKDGHAVGRWRNGAVGDMTIEQLTATSIKVNRIDSSGAAKGWRAVYIGLIDGDVIEGTLDAYTPKNVGPLGHPDATTKWHAVIRPDLKLMPAGTAAPASAIGWIECEDVGDGCSNDHPPAKFAWALGMAQDSARDLSMQYSNILLKVDSDLPNRIVIRRIDLDGRWPGLTGIYTGVREGSVMRGKLSLMVPGLGNVVKGTWMARQMPRTCTASARADQSKVSSSDIASMDFMLGDKSAAMRCLQLGADKGDLMAERTLAQIYHNGDGVPQDMAKAFALNKSLADQGDITAIHNLGVMYKTGQGTPVDTLRGNFYFDVEALRKQEIRDEAIQHKASNGFESIDAMLTSAFLHHITFDDQALRGRVEHRSDVIQHLNLGESRVQAEESAVREEIESRQKDLNQCRELHKDDYARFQEEQNDYRAHNGQPRNAAAFHDACTGDSANLDAYKSGSANYLACVHKYVESETIEAHCTY